jgi:hypothetical protein
MEVPNGPEHISNAPILTRPESQADVRTVDDVVGKAFDGRPNEVELVRRLRQTEPETLSRVATVDGQVVAHVMFSPLGLEGSKSSVLTLAPVSVEPEYQLLARSLSDHGVAFIGDAAEFAQVAVLAMVIWSILAVLCLDSAASWQTVAAIVKHGALRRVVPVFHGVVVGNSSTVRQFEHVRRSHGERFA